MSTWWYADKDKKVGPIKVEDIRQLLQTERIGPSSLVWREGMDTWRPLAAVDELKELRSAIPPSLPPKTEPEGRGIVYIENRRRARLAIYIFLVTLGVAVLVSAALPNKTPPLLHEILKMSTSITGIVCWFTCFAYYAKSKGYSGLVGVLLGFLTIIGIVILLLLPDKELLIREAQKGD